MICLLDDSLDAAFWFALEDLVVAEFREPVLLFWHTRPTLMIGNYQNPFSELNLAYARANGIGIIRRRSGGGAIYTDPNTWQFSLFYPGETGTDRTISESSGGVPAALRALGVPAECNGRNDILADGRKIAGNARHVHPQGLLHHGSLLFDVDFGRLEAALSPPPDKFLSKGIASVRQRVANLSSYLPGMTSEDFRDRMLDLLLAKEDRRRPLTASERADVLARAAAYRTWDWNFAEGPKFSVVRERKFPAGRVVFSCNVEKGILTDVALSGDFFADGDLAPLFAALRGCPLDPDELRRRLAALPAAAFPRGIPPEELLSLILS